MNKLILTALLTATCNAAFATTVAISFTGLPTTVESSTYGSTGATYNGNVAGSVNGLFSNLVCDDFAGNTYIPSGPLSYTAESLASLSGAMFTSGFAGITEGATNYTLTQTQAYDTAAVLMTSLEGLAVNSANANAITDYQYALWDLMSPNATYSGISDSSDATTTSILQAAFAQVLAGNSQTLAEESSLVIYTPTGSAVGNQEFLALDPAPEPASWALMSGLGLLLCVPQMRRRFKAAK